MGEDDENVLTYIHPPLIYLIMVEKMQLNSSFVTFLNKC